MKQIKFITDKGGFLLIDSKDAPSSFNRYLRDIEKELNIQLTTGYRLSEITEEEASQIVDYFTEYSKRYQDYERLECAYLTAIESLYSLLESKGVHLYKNPIPPFYERLEDFKEAEEKTFYNPYIFKL